MIDCARLLVAGIWDTLFALGVSDGIARRPQRGASTEFHCSRFFCSFVLDSVVPLARIAGVSVGAQQQLWMSDALASALLLLRPYPIGACSRFYWRV
jgi:hypothetical protein